MTYIKDMTERFPDAGEPAEEREYRVSMWLPVMVEVDVYGVERDDIIKAAKLKVKQSDIKRIMIDCDLSEMEFEQAEQI